MSRLLVYLLACIWLIFSAVACKSGKTPTPVQIAATAPARSYRHAESGIELSWPEGWTQQEAADSDWKIVRNGGGTESMISLSIPELPVHIAGLIPIGGVRNGYVNNLQRLFGKVEVQDLPPPTIADAKTSLVRATGSKDGYEMQQIALLIVRGDQVYLLKGRSELKDEAALRRAFDEVAASLRWVQQAAAMEQQLTDQQTVAPVTPAKSIWPWIVLLLALAFAASVRWRLRDVPLERDEGEYALSGQLMLQGVPPYREAYNMKFPGTYVAYAAIMAVFGQSPAGIHMGVMLVNLGAIVLLFLITRRLFNAPAGAVAAVVYALLTLDQGSLGLAGHATHFVVLAALAGIFLLLIALERDRLWILVVAGAMFGLAILMKQPGVFFVAFAMFWVATHHLQRPPIRWPRVLSQEAALVAGIMIPLVITGLILASAGVFGKFWFWTITYARQYGSEVSLGDAPRAFYDGLISVAGHSYALWLLALAGLMLTALDGPARRSAIFAGLLMLFGFLGASAGFYYRPHYFLLLMPAIAMFAGAGMNALAVRVTQYRSTGIWVLPGIFVALACWQLIWVQRDYLFELSPQQVSRALFGANPFVESVEIGRYLEAHTAPGERIAVFGSEPQILFYAHRRPATGFIYTYALMEDQPYALQMQKDMTAEIEKVNPRYIVFVNIPTSWLVTKRSPRWFQQWYQQLKKNYQTVGTANTTTTDESEYHWDEPKINPPLVPHYTSVLKRKD